MNRAPLAIAVAMALPLSRIPHVQCSTWAFGYFGARFNEERRWHE